MKTVRRSYLHRPDILGMSLDCVEGTVAGLGSSEHLHSPAAGLQ